MSPSLAYRVVDVFSDVPFAGNPLAVVLGAEALGDDQLQAIAVELNLSETAFPLPAVDPTATYRLRIFAPKGELDFAGHPCLGAAFVMARTGRLGAPGPGGSIEVIQECGAGLFPLTVATGRAGTVDQVELTAQTPRASGSIDPGEMLAAVGLSDAALAPHQHARRCSAGLVQMFIPVVADALADVVADPGALGHLADAGGWVTLSLFSWDAERSIARTRVLAGPIGWREDPGTGSAAAALGAWLAAEELVAPDATTGWIVEQGHEMGRPSRIEASVTTEHGRAVSCRIAGAVAEVAIGWMEVPRRP